MGKNKRCRRWCVGAAEWGKKNRSWRNWYRWERMLDDMKEAMPESKTASRDYVEHRSKT
ncbi:MAG: hypothetical protein WC322_03390 [Candidatus Paceibacterota bacterium]|jgi:hypothetical protein